MKHCKKKLFEMFLKKIDWKLIWKFCVTIVCGLHFDRTSRISCDEKCYDNWYIKNCDKVKTISKTMGPFKLNKLLY